MFCHPQRNPGLDVPASADPVSKLAKEALSGLPEIPNGQSTVNGATTHGSCCGRN